MTLDDQGCLVPMAREEIAHLTQLMGATFDADARAAGGVDSAWLRCYHCADFFEKWPPGCVDADHYTVWLDGRIAGAAVVWHYPEQLAVLGLLFVVPGRQRRGVGRWVWRTLEAAYPAARRWMVAAPTWSSRTQRFYERACGFGVAGGAGAYVSYLKERPGA